MGASGSGARQTALITGASSGIGLELARVMSKKKWDATLVFLAVAGEEQGLFGSTHWAKKARAENARIAGMISLSR